MDNNNNNNNYNDDIGFWAAFSVDYKTRSQQLYNYT